MATRLATPTLETERFILRPLERSDASALFPTMSDPEQCRYLLDPAFTDLETLEDWLCDAGWDGRSWSAIDRANGEVVARVVAMPRGERIAEVGYTTVVHRQGERIAEECMRRLLKQLFEAEGHHRVYASTDPHNVASNRLLEKLGFRLEGHYLESVHTHEGWCDEYFWGLLAREWHGQAQ